MDPRNFQKPQKNRRSTAKDTPSTIIFNTLTDDSKSHNRHTVRHYWEAINSSSWMKDMRIAHPFRTRVGSRVRLPQAMGWWISLRLEMQRRSKMLSANDSLCRSGKGKMNSFILSSRHCQANSKPRTVTSERHCNPSPNCRWLRLAISTTYITRS